MSSRDSISATRPFQSAARVDGSPRGSRRGQGFSDQMRTERRRERAREAVSAGTGVLASVAGGPVGALFRAVQSRLGGDESQGGGFDDMWSMQQESREFSREYLALQQQMQADNQQFQALSNLMKARHDTARAAISNMRV